MDERLKRQIVGGAVLLIALVVVINWLGTGAETALQSPEELAQTRETRVYDLSQLDTEGPLAATPAEQAPAPARPDAEDAAEGLPPEPAPEPASEPAVLARAPSEPVLAPPAEPVTKPAAEPADQPTVKPASTGGKWIVQVGSYGSEPNAQSLRAKLQKQGYATELAAVSLDGRPMYRLRVGPYADETAAREAADYLEDSLRQKVSVLKR